MNSARFSDNMVRTLRHILLVLLAALSFSSCSGDDEGVVIPRSKLAKIYAEMLVTDQWITSTPGVRMIADTSLVYAPILERYGYDLEDYLFTVDHYMNDPERFSRILRESGEIIGRQLESAELQLAEEQRLANLPKIESDFRPEEFFPYMFDEPYVHYYDSLSFEPDSLLQIYRLVPVQKNDTLFDGVKMVFVTDSLEIPDTLVALPQLSDTVEVKEKQSIGELIRTDSMLNRVDKFINEDNGWESRE